MINYEQYQAANEFFCRMKYILSSYSSSDVKEMALGAYDRYLGLPYDGPLSQLESLYDIGWAKMDRLLTID